MANRKQKEITCKIGRLRINGVWHDASEFTQEEAYKMIQQRAHEVMLAAGYEAVPKKTAG